MACYCGPECGAGHWPTHKASCKRLAADKALGPSPLLDALEVAFWGRTTTGGRKERLRRLEACVAEESELSAQWVKQTRSHPPAPYDATGLLQFVCLPPIVELASSSGGGESQFAAFIPHLFLGVFPTKQDALRAAYNAGASQTHPLFHPPHGPALTFGAHGCEPLPYTRLESSPPRARRLTVPEWACHARCVAKHFKPLREDAEATTVAYYKARRLLVSPMNYTPRLWETREDVLLVVAKGGGDDYSRELALGRPVRPAGGGSTPAAPPFVGLGSNGMGGFAAFGMNAGPGGGLQFMGGGALPSDNSEPLTPAELLEYDRRTGSLSPRQEDAMRYMSLSMQLEASVPSGEHRRWLATEMRRYTDSPAAAAADATPLTAAKDLLTSVRTSVREGVPPAAVLKAINELRRAAPQGMEALAVVVAETAWLRAMQSGVEGGGQPFLREIFGAEEVRRMVEEAERYRRQFGIA